MTLNVKTLTIFKSQSNHVYILFRPLFKSTSNVSEYRYRQWSNIIQDCKYMLYQTTLASRTSLQQQPSPGTEQEIYQLSSLIQEYKLQFHGKKKQNKNKTKKNPPPMNKTTKKQLIPNLECKKFLNNDSNTNVQHMEGKTCLSKDSHLLNFIRLGRHFSVQCMEHRWCL